MDLASLTWDAASHRERSTLNLLGVTLDRLLHFGPHCKRLKQRTRPRLGHLRCLTGRDWGLGEKQLRTVTNGYVRGVLEHAADAWLLFTPPSHVEVLEREMRAAALIITGCVRSTTTHALMAEAGLAPVAARRTTLAARLLAKARALPVEDPLRRVADAAIPRRLTSATAWREVGQEAWSEAGVVAPIEQAPPPGVPPPLVEARPGHVRPGGRSPPTTRLVSGEPTTRGRLLPGVSPPVCHLGVDGRLGGGRSAERRSRRPDRVAGRHLPGAPRTCRGLCSSYRAELMALRAALQHLLQHPAHEEDPVIFCTDSQAALAVLRQGPTEQREQLGVDVWEALTRLSAAGGRRLHLQWVPSHCGLRGNREPTSWRRRWPLSLRKKYRWTSGRWSGRQPGWRKQGSAGSVPAGGTAT